MRGLGWETEGTDGIRRFAPTDGHGWGWGVGLYGGQWLINHSGATLGFTSLVTLLPDAGLGVAVLVNATGVAARFASAVTLRLLELLCDLPPTDGAQFTSFLDTTHQPRAETTAQLGRIDPASVTLFPGQYASTDLGDMTLGLRAGNLLLTVGGFRSERHPPRGADGTDTAHSPVDAPFADEGRRISATSMTIGLQRRDAQPQVSLTIADDVGKDLSFRYERAGAQESPVLAH